MGTEAKKTIEEKSIVERNLPPVTVQPQCSSSACSRNSHGSKFAETPNPLPCVTQAQAAWAAATASCHHRSCMTRSCTQNWGHDQKKWPSTLQLCMINKLCKLCRIPSGSTQKTFVFLQKRPNAMIEEEEEAPCHKSTPKRWGKMAPWRPVQE